MKWNCLKLLNESEFNGALCEYFKKKSYLHVMNFNGYWMWAYMHVQNEFKGVLMTFYMYEMFQFMKWRVVWWKFLIWRIYFEALVNFRPFKTWNFVAVLSDFIFVSMQINIKINFELHRARVLALNIQSSQCISFYTSNYFQCTLQKITFFIIFLREGLVWNSRFKND